MTEALKTLDSGVLAAEAEDRAYADKRESAEAQDAPSLTAMQLQASHGAGRREGQPGVLSPGGSLAPQHEGASTADLSADTNTAAVHFCSRMKAFLVRLAEGWQSDI